MKNLAIKWGVIGGMISIITGLVSYLAGIVDSSVLQYITMLLMFLPIYFGQKEYQTLESETSFSFGDLFKFGMLALLVITAITTVWVYIYISYIDTELMNRTMKLAADDMAKSGMPEKDIENALKITSKFMTPAVMTMASTLSTIVFGLIFNAIVSAINKNK